MIEEIRQKARELLDNGAVDCVIGYETGTVGGSARPAFVYNTQEVDRLIFDNTCTHNLVRYLLNRRDKKTAIVVKPCDSRALNLLVAERQLKRDKVFAIGVVCPGVVWGRWKREGADSLQARCQICGVHTPPVYDFLIGEPPKEEPTSPSYPDVAEIEGKGVADRSAFWEEQFEHCIRCYACRQACPGCYCTECFAEQLDPEWVGIRIGLPQNQIWHTIRAFHLAGRCIACNECERVCVLNIPLSLLNRKLEKEASELFNFKSGMDAEALAPLATFIKDEKLGIAE